MANILLFIGLLLDGIISLLISNSSYLIPLITVTTIYMVYPLYQKKERNYTIVTLVTGLIYDLMYTDLLFFNAIIFYLIEKLSKYFHKNLNQSFIKTIIYMIIILITYELLTSVILLVYKIVPITSSKIIYKICHSLLINIIYTIVLYSVFLKRKQKN